VSMTIVAGHIAEESAELDAEVKRLAADQHEAEAALTGEELASLRAEVVRANAAFARGEGIPADEAMARIRATLRGA
jgi:hypothetical protein